MGAVYQIHILQQSLACKAFKGITKFLLCLKNILLINKSRYICCNNKNIKTQAMNKAELIAQLADDAGITKTQANAALDSFVDTVTKTLKKGDKVTLVGFGTFSVSKRAARVGRNPQTGEAIKIKAKKVARFKAGKELSAKI
jgi:DNA-binding protein HU-beta